MKVPVYNRKNEVVDHVLVDLDVAALIRKRSQPLRRHTQGYYGWPRGPRWDLLHRVITDAPKGMHVHHRNEDRRDNRRANLLVLTPGDHMRLHARMRRERKLLRLAAA